MKSSFVQYLRCPITLSKLHLDCEEISGGRIQSGNLISECGQYKYPIINFIPRFVNADNYANSFGWQWNKFKKTQFDSNSGFPITFNRFWKSTNWESKMQGGEWILDAGCGSGRFAEISSDTKANIVAIDFSNSVNACYQNLGQRDNLFIVQCDIYNLPFSNYFFDKIYSLGVLQHTPDVHRAVDCLSLKLRNKGEFCIDFYEKSFKSIYLPKYWLRPFTKKMKKEQLLLLLEKYSGSLLRISGFFKKIPIIGKYLARLVPIADYNGILPLSQAQIREWAILDTFDWLTPTYDNPQTRKTINKWLLEFGFENIIVMKEGHIVGRGTKI